MNEIRLMKAEDLPAVLEIQAECYPQAMNETLATIRVRLETSPDSAWVTEDEKGVSAYLMAYRSIIGKITPLGGAFKAPDKSNCLYLHDLAISSRARGTGLGRLLVGHAWQTAGMDGLEYSTLVSVQDSCAFWNNLGYTLMDKLDLEQRNHLATYVEPNFYMVKKLVASRCSHLTLADPAKKF